MATGTSCRIAGSRIESPKITVSGIRALLISGDRSS